MVRTKASNNAAPAATRKAVAARAPRKTVGMPRPVSSPSSSGGGRSRKGKTAVGGNPAKLWPTPEWQKGIGSFLKGATGQGVSSDQEEPGPSKSVHQQVEEEEEEEEVMMEQECGSSSRHHGGGVTLLDSSIAQLNSDDEDSD